MKIYNDTSVLIAAAMVRDPVHHPALELLATAGHEFVTSKLVEIELIPVPVFHGMAAELEFYRTYLRSASEWVPITDALIDRAIRLASNVQDLDAVDAVHAAAAISAHAVFVTAERPTKPLYRVPGLTVLHVSAAARVTG